MRVLDTCAYTYIVYACTDVYTIETGDLHQEHHPVRTCVGGCAIATIRGILQALKSWNLQLIDAIIIVIALGIALPVASRPGPSPSIGDH